MYVPLTHSELPLVIAATWEGLMRASTQQTGMLKSLLLFFSVC